MRTRFFALFLALIALLGAPAALALTLEEAKASGAVGEQTDGYLGIVQNSVDVRTLADDVNARRRTEYQRIADQNGVPVGDIEKLAGQKAVERAAAAGQWVRMPTGEWTQ